MGVLLMTKGGWVWQQQKGSHSERNIIADRQLSMSPCGTSVVAASTRHFPTVAMSSSVNTQFSFCLEYFTTCEYGKTGFRLVSLAHRQIHSVLESQVVGKPPNNCRLKSRSVLRRTSGPCRSRQDCPYVHEGVVLGTHLRCRHRCSCLV